MRTISAGLFISLDGVTDEPETWQTPYYNEELGALFASLVADTDAVLFGARSYKRFKAVVAGKTNADLPFADSWNAIPKYVVSTTLATVDWTNAQLITGHVAEEITKLTHQPGKNIATDASATLVRWLLHQGLLDELHLTIPPVVVGAGQRLFASNGESIGLQLLRSQVLRTGVVYVAYAPFGRA